MEEILQKLTIKCLSYVM